MKSSTIIALTTAKLSGMKTRDESRDLARVLRPSAAKFDVTVKSDIKSSGWGKENSWGVKLVHGDGKGTLSIRK